MFVYLFPRSLSVTVRTVRTVSPFVLIFWWRSVEVKRKNQNSKLKEEETKQTAPLFFHRHQSGRRTVILQYVIQKIRVE